MAKQPNCTHHCWDNSPYATHVSVAIAEAPNNDSLLSAILFCRRFTIYLLKVSSDVSAEIFVGKQYLLCFIK